MNQTCPICGKPQNADTLPFCSRRCADIDLGRWLTAQYHVPGEEGDPAATRGADCLDRGNPVE